MDAFTQNQVKKVIAAALEEDLQEYGDLTSQASVPPGTRARGRFLAKADGVVVGLEVAELVFAEVDKSLKVVWTVKDGDRVTKGTYFGTVEGPAGSLLTAERLALNLMQRMSGIATQTNAMVLAVAAAGGKTKVLDTRKTAPGLRYVDKLACRLGGGTNHRMGLYDMVMIKDNHVTAAGSITRAVNLVYKHLEAKGLVGKVEIEVETRTFDEVKEVLGLDKKVDRVMLDNMVKMDEKGGVDTTMLREALKIIGGKVATEASGNITLQSVGEVAKTGVDYVSSGALTHSVTALDISLKIQLIAGEAKQN